MLQIVAEVTPKSTARTPRKVAPWRQAYLSSIKPVEEELKKLRVQIVRGGRITHAQSQKRKLLRAEVRALYAMRLAVREIGRAEDQQR
jgi:hypothetical protein